MEFRLRSVAEALPPSTETGESIRRLFVGAGVADVQDEIRWQDYGRLCADGLLGRKRCGERDLVQGCPPIDFSLMEAKAGEWVDLINKYGDKRQAERAMAME